MATIVRQIGTIARALDSIANVEFKQHQLARGQYLYLVRIAEHPGIIAEQLSKMLKVDRATVSRAIAKLVQCGLVDRQTAPDNQKVKHLYVTEPGAQQAAFIQRENAYSEQIARQGLSATESQQLTQLLARVVENISADWDRVKAGEHRQY